VSHRDTRVLVGNLGQGDGSVGCLVYCYMVHGIALVAPEVIVMEEFFRGLEIDFHVSIILG